MCRWLFAHCLSWRSPPHRHLPPSLTRRRARLQMGNKRLNFDAIQGGSRSTVDASKPAVDKVDAVDASNPQYIVPYLQDIHRHYREAEGLKHASPSYMSKQTDINAKMRAILIDWLVEVHLKFKLMPETLYLTVNLIDRYLEKEQIMRNKLQLVGVTAMFIASKYEEIYAPECRDFVYISDKAYTRDEILRMEGQMLAKLNFQLTTPNAFVFVKRFAKVAGIATTPRSTTELLANYLVELTLQDYKMLKYLPSTICASAIYLALKTKGRTPWTPELEKHSTYKEADLQACVRDIHELHKNASTHSLQAVRKKYAQEKHGNVSSIAPAHLGW
eukprot:Transcript_14781.p1 GENE.Transcript_14781~~Transcript_14781.p1  ORF type:complete len:331 (-),score=182.44 Transcript_14781:239-1231(-)